jgi:hypothetical protein
MIEYLTTKRQFGYGGGILSPDCKQFIVNIPKNSSSFICDICTKNGWTTAEVTDCCDWHKVNEVIIVLRDPVKRWISGITQYLYGYVLNQQHGNFISGRDFVEKYYNKIVERIIFDMADRFDDHVCAQYQIFENILPEIPRTYFMIDSDFSTKFSNYIGAELDPALFVHSHTENSDKQAIHDFFKNLLSVRPDLRTLVEQTYAKDYQLINSTTFQ